MLETIYYLGAAAFTLFGLGYAAIGVFEPGCPFTGRTAFADSVVGRAFAGTAIGSIWPVFVPFALWLSHRERAQAKARLVQQGIRPDGPASGRPAG